jgi:hypothetical protein
MVLLVFLLLTPPLLQMNYLSQAAPKYLTFMLKYGESFLKKDRGDRRLIFNSLENAKVGFIVSSCSNPARRLKTTMWSALHPTCKPAPYLQTRESVSQDAKRSA